MAAWYIVDRGVTFLKPIYPFLALLSVMALFSGCRPEARYQPTPPESTTLKNSHSGYYSTKKAEDVREMAGTQFQTENIWSFSKTESGYRIIRTLDSMVARGYHKNSMPNELERKAEITLEFDKDMQPTAVRGYDTLHRVLAKIPQTRDEWRTQLLRMSDTVLMARAQMDLWRLFRLMPRDTPLVEGQSIDVQALNQTLQTFKADSAKFLARLPRLGKVCFDAAVYYTRTDSLVLLREQFLNSTAAYRRIRNPKSTEAAIKGTIQFAVNEKTGLPCYWSHTEFGEIAISDSAAKENLKVQLIRFEEDVVQ